MQNTGFEITKILVWSCDNPSTYDSASLSWKRTIATKCDQLAGSVNGYLDPRVTVEPNIGDESWFASPGNTMFGTLYVEAIKMSELREIMACYQNYLVDPGRLPNNVVYIDDDESFVRLSNLETYAKFIHGDDKSLASDDLARKRIPRSKSIRPLNLEPISNKCITQFHQAWSIICSHFDVSTQHRVDQSTEIDIARSNSDIVRVLFELDLMGIRGNRSDQDVRKQYEDQLLEPDKQKLDQGSKFGSSPTGLTNYNNQAKKLYKAATALKSSIELSRFIIGYFRGLHDNFQKQHLHSIVHQFKSFQDAIDYVNLSAIGLRQMNQGNWEEPPSHSANMTGIKRDVYFRKPDNSRFSSSQSYAPSASSSSNSASGGGHKIMHNQLEENGEGSDDELKTFIETKIAKTFEVYAVNMHGGQLSNNNNNNNNTTTIRDCSNWMNTGRCWRLEAHAKQPSMDVAHRCRFRHPELNSFTPPYK